MTSCSVVMVSYYTGAVLFPAIKSVLSQMSLAELIVVDNGNMPATLGRLQKMAQADPRLKIITGGGNVGFAKGCNEGVNFATGDFLLLLNPDCLLPPEAVPEMILAFNEMPGAKIVGAQLQNADGSVQGAYRKNLLGPLSVFRLSRKYSKAHSQTHEVAVVSSACLMLRRADYLNMGGMDDAFFLQLAEEDICLRTKRAGGTVLLCPRVKVTRLLGASGPMPSRFVEWQQVKSFIHYVHKHFPLWQALPADIALLARYFLRMLTAPIRRQLFGNSGYKVKLAARKLMLLSSGLAELPETQELVGKIVVVTGATSQLGICITRRLIAAGAAVLAISREENIAFFHPHLRWIKADLTDPTLNLHNNLADAVIHCAPLPLLPDVIHMLADAEVQRVIAFGSARVFSHALSGNQLERDLALRLAEAEDEIMAKCNTRGLSWTLIRPTLQYGYGLDKDISLLARFMRQFGMFFVLPPAAGRRQPVHVDDLAMAAMQLLEAPGSFGKSYNLGGGEILGYREMVVRIFSLCRPRVRVMNCRFLPFILDAAGVLLQKKNLSSEVALRMNEDIVFFNDEPQQDFGYTPRMFLSGGPRDLGGF